MFRICRLILLAGAVAFGLFTATAQATVVLTTPSLTGNVSITGFRDGNWNTFQASFFDLSGAVTAVALPDGDYTVSGQGAAVFTGFLGAGGTIGASVSSPLMIFTGALSSLGLTAQTYSGTFVAGTLGVHDTLLGTFDFTINYDGRTSTEILSRLSALLGFSFVNPQGSGTLHVTGTLYSDGADFSFTESNLDWVGFGALLYAADDQYGGANGTIDGSFALRNVSITAVPEPAPLALVGLALTALALARRRRQ